MKFIPRIETEWYKQHRWTKLPDVLEQDFLNSRGEFSPSYDIAFDRHLNTLNRNKRYEP
jgi:hypothetical protein